MAKDLKREDYLKLVGIVLLGFALRLIVFTFFIKEPEKHFLPGGQLGDAFWYDRIAVNLMNGNGFSAALTEPYLPDSIRTPIYPVFLTIIYCLFGHKIYFAILAQIFISLITAILVFNLSKLIWRSTTAGIASMSLFIVDPDTLFISNYLLTETLFTFFVTISLFLISKQWDNESWALLIISFIIMAIATLTRPIFIYLPMVIMGVVSVRYYKLGRLKDYIWIIILSLLSYFALISIWCYRNYRTFGVFEISPIGSYNLFYYGTAGIESQRLGISIDEARKKLDDTYFNDTKFLSLNFPKKLSIARNYALKHITKYPYYFSKITVNNIIATFLPLAETIKQVLGESKKTGLRDIFEQSGIKQGLIHLCKIDKSILMLLIGTLSFLLFIYVTVIVGIVRAIKKNHYYIIVLFTSVIAYLVIIPAITGYSDARFRIPAMPFMCVFSGFAFLRSNRK